ncbi:MAG: hypothetical protein DCC43_13355 [Candidatus Brocadia sp.]|uniref:Uncharacterized protein n=1 Tax=Candidatus Brocadia fulgida TaxID=380242 RepID=A0A0M2UT01_9BACT|nr:MAG: hypothetical protein BROFUL_02370 [Candidatus Brocadia fulgida]MCC6326307.1 hypothetical protein [Candidatus Brocadia sp.]MCE7911009.1 hypothetical protein [Candidatus Brocadia sp. AMX3]MBV6518063.1 hypothetical protein [Candidatus Brocadia fulgida]MDG5995737.1 hypothetical protein [Candidatus Brocadia sp.]
MIALTEIALPAWRMSIDLIRIPTEASTSFLASVSCGVFGRGIIAIRCAIRRKISDFQKVVNRIVTGQSCLTRREDERQELVMRETRRFPFLGKPGGKGGVFDGYLPRIYKSLGFLLLKPQPKVMLRNFNVAVVGRRVSSLSIEKVSECLM